MTYFEKLHPWCIVRPLPNLQRCIVARCRHRNDAESQVQLLRRLMPSVPYEIIFDVTPDALSQRERAKHSDSNIKV